MEVSCCASLSPVSSRDVAAGADPGAHGVPNPSGSLEFPWVPVCPTGSGRALLQARSTGRAGSSCLPSHPACCSLLTQSLSRRALPVSTSSFLQHKLSCCTNHTATFAFRLKIPAWNFPCLADWTPSCYTPPGTKLSSFSLPPCFREPLCCAVFSQPCILKKLHKLSHISGLLLTASLSFQKPGGCSAHPSAPWMPPASLPLPGHLITSAGERGHRKGHGVPG